MNSLIAAYSLQFLQLSLQTRLRRLGLSELFLDLGEFRTLLSSGLAFLSRQLCVYGFQLTLFNRSISASRLDIRSFSSASSFSNFPSFSFSAGEAPFSTTTALASSLISTGGIGSGSGVSVAGGVAASGVASTLVRLESATESSGVEAAAAAFCFRRAASWSVSYDQSTEAADVG